MRWYELGLNSERSVDESMLFVEGDRVVKAYSMLVFIARDIEYKSQEVMKQLYRTLARP